MDSKNIFKAENDKVLNLISDADAKVDGATRNAMQSLEGINTIEAEFGDFICKCLDNRGNSVNAYGLNKEWLDGSDFGQRIKREAAENGEDVEDTLNRYEGLTGRYYYGSRNRCDKTPSHLYCGRNGIGYAYVTNNTGRKRSVMFGAGSMFKYLQDGHALLMKDKDKRDMLLDMVEFRNWAVYKIRNANSVHLLSKKMNTAQILTGTFSNSKCRSYYGEKTTLSFIEDEKVMDVTGIEINRSYTEPSVGAKFYELDKYRDGTFYNDHILVVNVIAENLPEYVVNDLSSEDDGNIIASVAVTPARVNHNANENNLSLRTMTDHTLNNTYSGVGIGDLLNDEEIQNIITKSVNDVNDEIREEFSNLKNKYMRLYFVNAL